MKDTHQKYWEENIKGFSGFYDKGSEEAIAGPKIFVSFYKSFIFPIEKELMKKRFRMTVDYIQRNVKPGQSAVDIGCGSGIFTKYMVFCGAKVYAIDFAPNALALTRESLSEEDVKNVEFLCQDISERNIPKTDVSLALGVLPYVDNPGAFFKNILPFTSSIFFNFLDEEAPINRIRQNIKILDPRKYSYHRTSEIVKILSEYNFKVNKKSRLGQGYLIEAGIKS